MDYLSIGMFSLQGAFMYSLISIIESLLITREFKDLFEYGKDFLKVLIVTAFVLYLVLETDAAVITSGPVPF